MATIKQKRAVKKIVENNGNVSRAMIEAGYDLTTAKNPKNLTESKGYKEALRELGLTEELVTASLVEDIEKKPQNRVPELRLAAEILRMNETEGSGNKTLILMVSGESASRYNVKPNEI